MANSAPRTSHIDGNRAFRDSHDRCYRGRRRSGEIATSFGAYGVV